MKSDNTPLLPLLSSKDEELRDIGNSMRIRNLMLGLNSVTVSVLICYDTLSQNATDIITKCDSYFVTKCNRSLCIRFFITKCDNTQSSSCQLLL